MRFLLVCIIFFYLAPVNAQMVNVTTFGAMPNSFVDATESVQRPIANCRNKSNAVSSFPTGRYDFWPDKAVETHYYITNSSDEKEMPVKEQEVGLMLKNLKNITIEGNGYRLNYNIHE